MQQVCCNCAHPLAKAPMMANVQMFADPERKAPPEQTQLPFITPADDQSSRDVAPRSGSRTANTVPINGTKKSFTPRNFLKEARAEIKALDLEIKRLEGLKIHRAEVARMLEAATQIVTEKKKAKPLRAIA